MEVLALTVIKLFKIKLYKNIILNKEMMGELKIIHKLQKLLKKLEIIWTYSFKNFC